MANKPHKHAELITAFKSGAKIQRKCLIDDKWIDSDYPSWDLEFEYRIKPEQKPDVVKYVYADANCYSFEPTDKMFDGDNLKLTFDGETGKLKSAEIINEQ